MENKLHANVRSVITHLRKNLRAVDSESLFMAFHERRTSSSCASLNPILFLSTSQRFSRSMFCLFPVWCYAGARSDLRLYRQPAWGEGRPGETQASLATGGCALIFRRGAWLLNVRTGQKHLLVHDADSHETFCFLGAGGIVPSMTPCAGHVVEDFRLFPLLLVFYIIQ